MKKKKVGLDNSFSSPIKRMSHSIHFKKKKKRVNADLNCPNTQDYYRIT